MKSKSILQMKKFEVGKMLIYGAAMFQAYQFGRALNIYDPFGWNVNGVNVGGLILGVIVNVSAALAATRLPSLKGKSRTWAAWIGFSAILVLSPALIAPAMYLLLASLPIEPGWRVFLAIGLATAPDIAIALSGFIAGKSLLHLLSDDLQPQSKPQSEGSGHRAKKSKSLVMVACRYEGTGCKMKGSQNAMNAHAPHCKFKPTIDDSLMLKNKTESKS